MDALFKAHQEASEAPTLPPASGENQTERLTRMRFAPDQGK